MSETSSAVPYLDHLNFWLGVVFGNILAYRANHLAVKHHEVELAQQQKLHEIEIDAAKELHFEDVQLSKRLHMMEINSSMQQHLQSLNSDVIAANRESERDMYEQRNQQYGTIILSSTIMFTALCTVMLQAQLPVESGLLIENLMAIAAGSSFAFLFLCIVLCTKLIVRTSQFM
jgi:hypothetical protein